MLIKPLNEKYEFENLEDAKEYWRDRLGKYDAVRISVSGKNILLCCTNLFYEDEIWTLALNSCIKASEIFHLEDKKENFFDETGDIRDAIVETITKHYNFEIELIYEEF